MQKHILFPNPQRSIIEIKNQEEGLPQLPLVVETQNASNPTVSKMEGYGGEIQEISKNFINVRKTILK